LNFNATLLGQVILIFIPIIVILSYYLGKRKTQTPKLATLIGLILAFIPPLALIYVAALVIKNDVRVSE
jgi:4-amino-4-deoxy-L-arabinose transferase-like glycosyltransferase